ncbi:MAG: hypothetical protein J0L75_08400 [Spirochaetes bacterium]|nr:hypothetical protein [Spirochaetota bacterium]
MVQPRDFRALTMRGAALALFFSSLAWPVPAGDGVRLTELGLVQLDAPGGGERFLGAGVAQPVWMVNARGDLLFPTERSETPAGWRWRTPGGFIELSLGKRGDDLALTLRGEGKDLRAIGFKFKVKRGVEILVPGGRNGLALRAQDVPREERFSWPRRWEAPVIVGEGERGSFAVWSEDPASRYQSVILATNGGELMVSLEAENFAPFTGRSSIEAPTWYLRSFDGGYQRALEPFQKWMRARYLGGLPPLETFKSSAVQALVVLPSLRDGKQAAINARLAEILSRELEAKKTLLWTVTWYDDESYGRKPDLPTPMEGFRGMNEAAHRLGFVNFSYLSSYAAITKASRIFAECEPWLFNDEKTGQPMFYAGDRVPHFMASGLAPALQKAHGETIAALVRELGVDVVSLEQTSATWNVDGAFRGGKSGIDGIRELHEAVRRAAPGAELAAEGMADLLLPFDRFHQTHVWQAIYEPAKQVAFPLLARAHPISSYLFYPYSRKIAFLDIVNPTSAFYWQDLKPAFVRWGVLPSLRFDGSNALKRLGMRLAFEEARVWQRVSGEMRFAAKRTDAVALELVGKGADARYALDGDGNLEFTEGNGSGPRSVAGENAPTAKLVYALIRGKTKRALPRGAIPDWPAWDTAGAIGLDPSCWYLADGRSSPANLCAHLSSMHGRSIRSYYMRGQSVAVFLGGAKGTPCVLEGIGDGTLFMDGGEGRPIPRGPQPIAPADWICAADPRSTFPVLSGPKSPKELLFSSHAVMGKSGLIDPPASAVEKEDLADHPPCEFQGRREEGVWMVPVNFGLCRALLCFRAPRAGTLSWKPVLCLAREKNLSGIAWSMRLDGESIGKGRKAASGWEDLPALGRPISAGLHAIEVEIDADGRWDGDLAFLAGTMELLPPR